MKQLVTAAFVAPMDVPLLRDGGVVVESGRIRGVGPAGALRAAHPDARRLDLGDAIVLPGLINAHTHLELSACAAGDSPGGSFGQWILSIRDRLTQACADHARAIQTGTHAGIAQCLRFGVTTVGDISQQFHLTRPILHDSRLRAVSFGEALGLAQARPRFEDLLARAADTALATDRLRIGLSPHAPYTVDLAGFREALNLAERTGLPLATHLAETTDETDFLLRQTGVFRDVWESLGTWSDGVQLLARPPVEMAAAVGLLAHPTVLAHVNYCTDEDLARLARGRASVIYCPRTHRYFAHPPHRWRDMLAAGINVAIGTDSCASSPDLNLVDDLRLVHSLAPDYPVDLLWQMVTTRAAAALTWSHAIGSLTPGKWADLVAFPVTGADPLRIILETPCAPGTVMIAGEVVR